MKIPDSNCVRPGDSIVCSECGRSTLIKQSWMESTAKLLKAKGLWPARERGGYAVSLISDIPIESLQHLTCQACDGKGAVKLVEPVRSARPPAPSQVSDSAPLGRCTVCGRIAIPGDSLCYTHNN